MSYLSINALTASYPDFNLSLSFALEKGEFVSIIGPSGCGKSTTLSLISGLLPVKSGTITLDGVDITGKRPQERGIGMVFQDYALFPHLNVAKNIGYPFRLRCLKRKMINKEVEDLLAFVHLSGYGKRRIDSLSGGEQQRVALARSIAANPKILLLDEPLSALDAALRRRLRDEIRVIHEETGTTFLYVTHDREEAFSISDRIIVMKDGGIEMIGTPEEVYQKPRTLFTASFTGDGTLLPSDFFEMGAEADSYFFRPEDVRLQMPGVTYDPAFFFLFDEATIESAEFVGKEYLLGIQSRGKRLIASVTEKPKMKQVSLAILREKMLAYRDGILLTDEKTPIW